MQSNQGFKFRFSPGGRFLSLPFLFFLVVAAALLYFVAVRFDLSPGEIWTHLKDANPWLLALAFLMHYAAIAFRAARWRILLKNAEGGAGPPPSLSYCGGLIMVALFVNSVTAFHVGDLYRAYLYSSERGQSLPQTVGTLLAERTVDVFTMFALLMAAALGLLALGSGAPWAFLALASLLPAAIVLGLLFMRFLKNKVARFLPVPLAMAYERFHGGALGSFANISLLVMVVIFGVLAWLAEAARLYLVAQALGFSLSLPLVIFASLANAVLSLLPLGGLGFAEFGVAELLARSLVRSAAGSVAILDRAISYVSVIIVGGVVFLARNFLAGRSFIQDAPARD